MTAAIRIAGGRFAITGGLSLLGEHLRQELIRAGADHVVLVDNLAFHDERAPASLDDGVELRRADIRDSAAVEEALAGTDGIFHTAAYVTLPLAERPLEGVDVNVRGTETVLGAASKVGAGKVVLSASVAMYGNASDDPILEEAPFRTSGLQPTARLYGASKIMAEAFCQLYWRNASLPYVSLRYSSLYGESQRGRGLNAMHLWDAYEQMARGETPTVSGSAYEAHDYLHASDAARANLAAMASDISDDAFTIATGRSVPLADAIAELAELMGFDHPARFEDSAGRTRFATTEVLNYDISKAMNTLDWQPEVSLREGLRRVITRDTHGKESDEDAPGLRRH